VATQVLKLHHAMSYILFPKNSVSDKITLHKSNTYEMYTFKDCIQHTAMFLPSKVRKNAYAIFYIYLPENHIAIIFYEWQVLQTAL